MPHSGVHQREVTVRLESGLHMTPLSRIVQLVQRYHCEVKIHKGAKAADASSMLDLMTLGAEHGAVLQLEASGDHASEALDALVALFDANFEDPPLN